MKSIKEEAHEIGWVYSKHYDPTACKQEWCEMAAREGANYVLEQIEEHINRLEYGLNANCMVTAKNACECLRSIIESLKK